MKKPLKVYIGIIILTIVAALIALPEKLDLSIPFTSQKIELASPRFSVNTQEGPRTVGFVIRKGLDIQGGMRILLDADMSQIPEADRVQALESAKEVLTRRVDLFGISEPSIKTSISNNSYRIVIELPGVTDPQKAVELVGETAKLEFMLIKPLEASTSAEQSLSQVTQTDLDGSKLKRATLQFDQKTGKPVVGIEFNSDGATTFSKITEEHVGEMLGIILDGQILMAPQINEPIFSGSAVIQGNFTVEDAKQLSIQLNAGALPVPIKVIEQSVVNASLGEDSVNKSVMAGLIGLAGVIIFMIAMYGMAGVLASFALCVYALLTIALYKIIGVTITVPGIAGLLLSIGMAVDANILIFERIKEETRLGKPFARAMELGFGRAWDSIKDANVTTIITSLVLINPLNFSFLNTSGLVRGFGITLLIGVVLGLFTSIVVSRTFLRMFLKDTDNEKVKA